MRYCSGSRALVSAASSTHLGRVLGVAAMLAVALGTPLGCSDTSDDGTGVGTGGSGGSGTGGSGTGGGGTGGGGGGFGLEQVPNLELDPGERERFIVDTGMDVGASQTYSVGITNTGLAPLMVSEVWLDYTAPSEAEDGDHPAFALVNGPTDETTIYPQQGDEYPKGLEIQLSYTRKEDTLSRTALLHIVSNDPDEPNVLVTFSTETGSPRLSTDRTSIDFPLIAAGQVGKENLGILNTGTRTLMVSGFKITKDGRFGVDGDGWAIGGAPDAVLSIDLPQAIAIPAGSLQYLEVTFYSDSPTPAEGKPVHLLRRSRVRCRRVRHPAVGQQGWPLCRRGSDPGLLRGQGRRYSASDRRGDLELWDGAVAPLGALHRGWLLA